MSWYCCELDISVLVRLLFNVCVDTMVVVNVVIVVVVGDEGKVECADVPCFKRLICERVEGKLESKGFVFVHSCSFVPRLDAMPWFQKESEQISLSLLFFFLGKRPLDYYDTVVL